MTPGDLENWFMYHPPSEAQREAYEKLRTAAKDFAYEIYVLVPDCADKTHALRVLRDSVMWANAAIACNSPTDTPGVPT